MKCPGCGLTRRVSSRHARNWRNGAVSTGGLCSTCRGHTPMQKYGDSHLRFWLQVYGVKTPRGGARNVIASGGAPPELIELARQVWPDTTPD